MFKSQEEQVAVLGVCVDPPRLIDRTVELNFHMVNNGRRAIDMLRLLSFDFVLVGLDLPDMSTWDFQRHLKRAMPHLKWAVVGSPISDQQEVAARTLGATILFDTTPTSKDLLSLTARMRDRAAENVLSNRFDDIRLQVARRKFRTAV